MAPGVSASLELTADEAFREIDRLEQRLARVAGQFGVDLAESLVAIAGTEVSVTARVESITESIDEAVAAATPEVTVDVEADTAAAEAEIGSLDADTVTVDVEADTADAQSQIEALSGSSSELAGAADEAAVGLSGLAGGAAGVSKNALLAVGGTAAFVGVTKELFSSAVEAEGSLQAFEAALGASADAVRSIQVGSLDADLNELAISLGSSDEALQDAAVRIFSLGESFGVARPEIEKTTENIIALAARAVAIRPSLGDVGTVSEQLFSALQRGSERALGPFSTGLTKAAIEAEILRRGLKPDELTAFEKASIAAELAVSKLGPTLGETVAAGAENAQIKLRSLKERFGELFESAGAPLVLPIFEALEAALPAVEPLLRALGELAVEVLPVLVSALQGVVPVLEVFAAILTAVPSELVTFGAAMLTISKALGIAQVAMVAFGVSAQTAGRLVSLSNPIFAVAAAALAAYAVVTGKNRQEQAEFESALKETTAAISGQASEAEAAFSKLVSEKLLSGTDSLSKKLLAAGITVEGLSEALRGGEDAAKAYGESHAEVKDLSFSEVKELIKVTEALEQGQKAAFDNAVATGALTDERQIATVRAQEALGAEVDYVAELQTGTRAAEEAAAAEAAHAEALAALAPPSTAAADAAATLAEKILSGTAAAGDFETAAAAMGVETSELIELQKGLAQAVDSFVEGAVSKFPTVSDAIRDLNDDGKVSIDEFVANLESQATQIQQFGVLLQLAIAQGFTNLATFLTDQGPSILGADGPIAKSIAEGNVAELALLDQKLGNYGTHVASVDQILRDAAGPLGVTASELAAQISEQFGITLDITKPLEDQTPEAQAALAAAGVTLGPEARTAGAEVAGKFGEGANLEASVRRNVALGRIELQATGGILSYFAFQAGQEVGLAFDSGIALGIIRGSSGVRDAARFAVDSAEAAARSAARASSPSKLFAELGQDMADGIALGFSTGTESVVGEAERIIDAAARATAATEAVAVPAAVAAGAGVSAGATGGGVSIGSVSVDVNVTGALSDDDARRAGAAIAVGFEGELVRRQISVDARIS